MVRPLRDGTCQTLFFTSVTAERAATERTTPLPEAEDLDFEAAEEGFFARLVFPGLASCALMNSSV